VQLTSRSQTLLATRDEKEQERFVEMNVPLPLMQLVR
jgi:hypothetical protein